MREFSIFTKSSDEEINQILSLVGLDDAKGKKVKDFSLGMKQRLGIAISMLGSPEFIILDEPINGLDPAGIKEIRDIILHLNQQSNITFLISSHLLDELSKIATRYGIIDNGVLMQKCFRILLHIPYKPPTLCRRLVPHNLYYVVLHKTKAASVRLAAKKAA